MKNMIYYKNDKSWIQGSKSWCKLTPLISVEVQPIINCSNSDADLPSSLWCCCCCCRKMIHSIRTKLQHNHMCDHVLSAINRMCKHLKAREDFLFPFFFLNSSCLLMHLYFLNSSLFFFKGPMDRSVNIDTIKKLYTFYFNLL